MIKKIFKILIPILLLDMFFVISAFSQYTIDNTGGKLNNIGTIRVKSGHAKSLPDTIGGRVEFLHDGELNTQIVPNVTYTQLVIRGRAEKKITGQIPDKALVTLDSVIIDSNGVFGLFDYEVHAKAAIVNSASVVGDMEFKINNEDTSQTIQGDGKFRKLYLDNPLGADVINRGGFEIARKLELKRGDLRNDSTNNFYMSDSALIVRHYGSSLADNPKFNGRIDVIYEGDGEMVTGGEIPGAPNVLHNWIIGNTGGVNLSKSATVNDSLYLASSVLANEDTLSLASTKNPVFNPNDVNVEIVGRFQRKELVPGDTMILNNPYTKALFETEDDIRGAERLITNIRRKEYPEKPFGQTKIQRLMDISLVDTAGEDINNGFSMWFQYGFRFDPNTDYDESNGLPFSDLVFQRWVIDEWFDLQSEPSTRLDEIGWAYGSAFPMSAGSYAIGTPGFLDIAFAGKFFLEGPYIENSGGKMKDDLWRLGYLDQPPPMAYPVNLNETENFENYESAPDSVVDWVVLEFREERNSQASFFKTGFIRKDGMIVDKDGSPGLRLRKSDGLEDLGDYYVIVRHRNHGAVITAQPLNLTAVADTTIHNLSDPDIIEGGSESLKLVEVLDDGELIFALRGGYRIIDEEEIQAQMRLDYGFTKSSDHEEPWKKFTLIGYDIADYNLSGIVTTKDFNISWNNREME